MATLTLQRLINNGACYKQRKLFRSTFGDSAAAAFLLREHFTDYLALTAESYFQHGEVEEAWCRAIEATHMAINNGADETELRSLKQAQRDAKRANRVAEDEYERVRALAFVKCFNKQEESVARGDTNKVNEDTNNANAD